MAKLTMAKRNALPSAGVSPAGDFAGPDRGSPMPDKAHAANAKSKHSALKAKVDAKANKVMKESKGTPKVKAPIGAMVKSLAEARK